MKKILKEFKSTRIILTMPVYNERKVIEEVIRKNFFYIKKFNNSQLIVSEDGSTDGTKELLKKLRKKLGFTLFLSQKRKGAAQGQRDALKAALDAGADVILFTDSDNQHDPDDFDMLLEKIRDFEMVVGWKQQRHDPYWRKLGSKLWNFYARFLFGVKLHDVNCGFRAIRKRVLQKILTECDTFSECTLSELSIRAKFAGFKQAELPVKHFIREDKPKAWNPKKIPLIACKLFLQSLSLKKAFYSKK